MTLLSSANFYSSVPTLELGYVAGSKLDSLTHSSTVVGEAYSKVVLKRGRVLHQPHQHHQDQAQFNHDQWSLPRRMGGRERERERVREYELWKFSGVSRALVREIKPTCRTNPRVGNKSFSNAHA